MKRRILFTASTYSHIINFHRPYLMEFKRRGWQVDVACGGREKKIPEADHIIHIPLKKSLKSPDNLAAFSILRRQLKACHYDLVSCHTALASFFTRLAVLTLPKRPLVACTVHGYLFGEPSRSVKNEMVLSSAEAMVSSVTDLLMTMNDWDYKYAKVHKFGKRIVNIPGMGLDVARLPDVSVEEAARFREQLGFGREQFLMVYGAEFSERKNQSFLLRALQQLPERVGLLLPGDGQLRDTCIALARQLGVEHRVAFPGQVDDMPLWYAAADCAVSSSRSEGLPFNLMEAMHYGLPIVASDIKGHADLIRNNQTGLLFQFENMAQFIEQIWRLLEEPELSQRIGPAAKDAVEPFILSNAMPQVLACYESLLPLGSPAKELISV